MKTRLLGIALLAMAFTVFSALADDCADTVACVNQVGDTYCVPEDTTCTFTTYTGDSECVADVSESADSDSDGWSDGCDAFPQDPEEWMDIDGDNCGHNEDTDDFDAAAGCPEDSDPQEEEQDPTPAPRILGGKGKVYCTTTWVCTEWSECDGQVMTRTCTKTEKPDNCDVESTAPKPEEELVCFVPQETGERSETAPVAIAEEPDDEDSGRETSYEVDIDMPDEEEQGMGLTGRVISFVGNPGNMFFAGLIMACILLLFVLARKKRKE